MDFITLQEVKDFEGLRSTDSDGEITSIVKGVNTMFTSLLDADNVTDHVEKPTASALSLFLDTDALAASIVAEDASGNTLTGLTGLKGNYTLSNPYIGLVKFTLPTKFSPVPDDLKMAALYMARHFRKAEYKSSESGSGQAVSFVSLSNNIPKHVLAVLSIYRPI